MPRLILLVAVASALSAQPLRVQLTTGGHDHDIAFYSLFLDQPDWRVTVNPHPSAFRSNLTNRVDVLVLYDMIDLADEKQKANLQAFVNAGRGVVLLHHALCGNWQWEWWYRDLAGGRCVPGAGPEPLRMRYKHGEVMNIAPVAQHPILAGVGPFRIVDETYRNMTFTPGNQVLLETDHPDADRPVAWIRPHPKSRIVTIQLGHGPEAHANPSYRRLIQNAVRWAGQSTATSTQ